jgi:hypothetical protein
MAIGGWCEFTFPWFANMRSLFNVTGLILPVLRYNRAMDVTQIIVVVAVIAVLFVGYAVFTGYIRNRAKRSRRPGFIVTKVYQDLAHFQYEAPKMVEGGYAITYISSGERYLMTEGMTLEQIMAGPMKRLNPDGNKPVMVNYTL